MPARIVDGDAISRSKTLKKVPVEYRSEYALLLTVAEANGAFEYDADRIWSDLYSYNRPDISLERCVQMLDAFVSAGMIETYEQGGKHYGFFPGIDKPGRLPSAAHQARYAGLPPKPQQTTSYTTFVMEPELLRHDAKPLGSRGFVAETPVASSGNRPIETEVESRVRAAVGHTEDRKTWSKELRAATKEQGYDVVLMSLDLWLESQTTFTGRRPVAAFLRALPSLAGAGRPNRSATVKSEALQQVEDAIALVSNNVVVFSNQEKPHLALLVKEHGPVDVIQVFRDFYGKLDEFGQKWATKNFLEKAPQFLRTVRIQREERDRQTEFATAQAAHLQQQADAELATLSQQEAAAAALADEAFSDFA